MDDERRKEERKKILWGGGIVMWEMALLVGTYIQTAFLNFGDVSRDDDVKREW